MNLKNYTIIISLLLSIPLLYCSCNITKYHLNRTHRKLEKFGQIEWNCENDSSSMHFRKVGRGDKNLILLHGFGPATEMQWIDIVKYLYNDFTIYIPDLVYFGKSFSDSENYDPRFISRQIYNCINKENLDNLYVV